MAAISSNLCRMTGQALGVVLGLLLLVALTGPLGFLGALVLAVLAGVGVVVGLQRFSCQGSAGQGPVAASATQAREAVVAPPGEVQPGAAPVQAPLEAPVAEGIAAPVETAGPEEVPQGAEAGPADDLQQLKGVGPKLAEALTAAGITRFAQIAAWTEADLAWVDENVKGARGRASRDGWIAQAREMSAANGAG